MTAMPPSDVVDSFADDEWLRFLLSERRPNLLMVCTSGMKPVVARLMNLCTQPLHALHLPGKLVLPKERIGTLLLWDVAQLTLDQQIQLHDWMNHRQDAQVISLTSAPLLPLVEQGEFSEALFYRINIVSLFAGVCDADPAGSVLSGYYQ